MVELNYEGSVNTEKKRRKVEENKALWKNQLFFRFSFAAFVNSREILSNRRNNGTQSESHDIPLDARIRKRLLSKVHTDKSIV